MSRRRAQALHELHAEPDGAAFPAAMPTGVIDVDRQYRHAMPFRILDQRGRMVETHRPRVEQCDVERGRVMRFQIRARICDQREAGRVRLGETVQRE